MFAEKTVSRICEGGLMPTAFIYDLDDTLKLAETMNSHGIHLIELLQRTENAPAAVSMVKEKLPDMLVGAGTVLTPETARTAIASGADYIVGPFFRPEIAEVCALHDVAYVPGCATITEVSRAYDAGLRCLKFFPAKELGGPEMIRQISEIYADVRYVVTGGFSYEDIFLYAAIDYVAAIGTTCMMPQSLINAHCWSEIGRLTEKAVSASLGIELAYVREGADCHGFAGLMAGFSLGRAGLPEFPEAVAEARGGCALGLYTNSVLRTAAYLKAKGISVKVLEESLLGPVVADAEMPGIPGLVRLVSRSRVYRA